MKKILLLFLSILFLTNIHSQTIEIYVSDGGNFNLEPWQILKSDETGENVETFITEELGWPQDILFLEDQNILLVSNLNTGKITKYNIDDGTYVGDFATGIDGPTRMKIGSDSLLYVLQWQGNGKVKRYQLDGTFVDDFTNSGVSQSIGIDWDLAGNLYVSSWGGAKVESFDTLGNSLGNFITSSLQGPTNIWFNEDGELLVANWSGTAIKRFDASGNYIDDFITGLGNPEGVDYLPSGNILIGNGQTSAVKLFDPNGNFIEDIIPSGTADLILPNAVRVRVVAAPVSTTQIETALEFIQPTIGTSFYLSSKNDLNIKVVSIYNFLGVLIETRIISDNQIWNANQEAEGIYLIVAESTDGDLYTQKVFLKR